MPELLERTPEATAPSHSVWLDRLIADFGDSTPVSRPAVRSDSYDALAELITARVRAYLDPAVLLDVLGAFGAGRVEVSAASIARALERAGRPELTPTAAHPGTEALQQLQEWLNLSLDHIVELAGLGPSTRAYWRKNPTAPIRPGKTGRLLRFRTGVGLLVAEVGLETARARLHSEGWLEQNMDEPRLVAFEAWVHEQMTPGGPTPPTYLRHGLSREELRARALRGVDDEVAQLAEDREKVTQLGLGDDAPEEP
jgi:hypothetical protein